MKVTWVDIGFNKKTRTLCLETFIRFDRLGARFGRFMSNGVFVVFNP
jgi:hypothetical protein